MAKKTKSLREPPTVSSSNSSEEEQLHNHEEEEDEDSSEKDQPVSKNPPPPSSTSHPNPESETESDDSGSESESDPPPPPPSTSSKVKSLQSKPKDQTPKPNPKKDRSTSKRPAKNNESENDSKRAKRKVTLAIPAVALSSEDKDDANQKPKPKPEPKPVNDARKLFQRLWSDEDEIAILKGMAEFTSNTGNDPSKNADAFYHFVKKSLHIEASINQLKEKIRRLKKKYQNHASKRKPPTFSKPHDQEAFALSQKVWGDVEEEAVEIPTQEDRAVEVARPRPKHEVKSNEVKSKDSKKAVVTNPDEKDDSTSYLTGMILLDKGFGSYGMNEDLVKRGMDLIEESQREELEGQWREVQDAELGLAVQRAELVAHQARLILEAFKSSTD